VVQRVENLSDQGFFVQDWKVTPAEGVLSRCEDLVRLEPKVMEVLVYLASRQGEVVSRDELERDVWRGAIVGYDAVTATVLKLRKALQDDARHSRIIVTIPKRGYQLIAKISPIQADSNNSAVSKPVIELPPSTTLKSPVLNRQNRNRLVSGVVVTTVAVILLAIGWLQSGKKTSTEMPSIVVLPIENLDSDDKNDLFVDGITEDIITDLSRIRNLTVFASATTFKYRGQPVSPQALRKDLGVNYVLTGNARRHGDDIRFNIQLINADNGLNVWAQRYDRKTKDVFAVQDEITASVINALAIELSSEEKQNLAQRATDNLTAYEYFLEGQRLSRDQTQQTNAAAREAYRHAIELDPTYGRAYGALAYTLALDYRHGWTDTPLENLDRALELADKGVALDSSIPQTYWSLGYVYLRRGDFEKALNAAQDSIRVSPNYADGYGLLALISNGMGQAKGALQYARRGMKLNPYYTWDYLFNVGFAYYLMGDYAQAIESLEKAQARNENASPVKMALAACYVHVDRMDDAQWMVEQIQMLNPSTTISLYSKTMMLQEPNLRSRLLDDLRKAGLPE